MPRMKTLVVHSTGIYLSLQRRLSVDTQPDSFEERIEPSTSIRSYPLQEKDPPVFVVYELFVTSRVAGFSEIGFYKGECKFP